MKLELDLDTLQNESPTHDQTFIDNENSEEIKKTLRMGISLANERKNAEARQVLLSVTEKDPQNETAWLWLASVSEYPEELLVFLQNVLKINPENERALVWEKQTRALLSKILVQRGINASQENQRDFAKQCFLQGIVHNSENEMAWLWLASISDLQEEKLSHLQKVLQINPENETALQSIEVVKGHLSQGLLKKANTAAINGDNETAKQLLESLIKTAPKNDEVWILSAFLANDFQEKIACYEKALALNPNNEAASAGMIMLKSLAGKSGKPSTQEAPASENNAENGFVPEELASHEESASERTDQTVAQNTELELFPIEPDATFEQSEQDYMVQSQSFEEDMLETASADDVVSEVEATLMDYHTNDFEDFQADEKTIGESTEDVLPEHQFSQFYSKEAVENTHDDMTNTFSSAIDDEEFNFTLVEHRPTETVQNIEVNSAQENVSSADEVSYNPTQYFANSGFTVVEPVQQHVWGETAQPTQELSYSNLRTYQPESIEKTEQLQPDAFPDETPKVEEYSCEIVQKEVSGNSTPEPEHNSTFTELEQPVAEQFAAETAPAKEIVDHAENAEQHDYVENDSAFLPEERVSENSDQVMIETPHEVVNNEIHITTPSDTGLQCKTILVVDDSPTVRKLISGKLTKCGHQVEMAIDGMEALAKLSDSKPDLILLDITMPRLDGYQVCKMIKNNDATKDIPVVMISGKDGFFDKVRGRMAGSSGYITKPFGPDTLMKTIETYLG